MMKLINYKKNAKNKIKLYIKNQKEQEIFKQEMIDSYGFYPEPLDPKIVKRIDKKREIIREVKNAEVLLTKIRHDLYYYYKDKKMIDDLKRRLVAQYSFLKVENVWMKLNDYNKMVYDIYKLIIEIKLKLKYVENLYNKQDLDIKEELKILQEMNFKGMILLKEIITERDLYELQMILEAKVPINRQMILEAEENLEIKNFDKIDQKLMEELLLKN